MEIMNQAQQGQEKKEIFVFGEKKRSNNMRCK